MYQEVCLQQRRHFLPLVISVDELLGVEAEATPKRVAIRLTKKWRHPYSRTCWFSRVRLPSLWCRPHTGAFGGPGWRCTILSYRTSSGRTASGSTCSDRRNGRSPDTARPPPHPNHQIYWSWRPNPTHQSQREHRQAAGCTAMTG